MIDPGASTTSTHHIPHSPSTTLSPSTTTTPTTTSPGTRLPVSLESTIRRTESHPNPPSTSSSRRRSRRHLLLFPAAHNDPLTEPLLLTSPTTTTTTDEVGTTREGPLQQQVKGENDTHRRRSHPPKDDAHDDDMLGPTERSRGDESEPQGRHIFCASCDNDDVGSSLDEDDEQQQQQHHHHHHHVPWYKNPYQRMAMISNFCTSYNVVNISLVLPILEQLQTIETVSTLKNSSLSTGVTTNLEDVSTEDTSIVASSLLAGMIVGQVVGGALGDAAWMGGLAGALRVVMMVQIVASLASASVSFPTTTTTTTDTAAELDHFYWKLSLWRFLLGIGAGAVYPLAACLSVEQAGCRSSGGNHVKAALKRVVRTFSLQGAGFWMVPAVTLPLLSIRAIPLAYTWRIVLALGAVPGLGMLWMQWHWLYRSPQTRLVVPTQDDDDNEEEEVTFEAQECLGNDNQENTTSQFVENGGLRHCHADGMSMTPERNASQSTIIHSNQSPPRGSVLFAGGHGGDSAVLAGGGEDSDGEVGTFLDSAPDLSSGDGCYGASEPPVIRYGWWASIVSEPDLCRKLLGTAATWFLFDVLFYGNTLFQAIVVEATFGPAKNHGIMMMQLSTTTPNDYARRELQRTALDSLLLASIALPGYIVAGLLIGRRVCRVRQSVRYVMLQGFGCMSLLYLILGWYWGELRRYSPGTLIVLYGLTFFFANYGPNTTTFVLPALVYSPECRSTWNGFSAAAGKVGALCGATLFAPAARRWGDATVLKVCAVLGALAFGMTLAFVHIPASMEDPAAAAERRQAVPTRDDEEALDRDALAAGALEPTTDHGDGTPPTTLVEEGRNAPGPAQADAGDTQ